MIVTNEGNGDLTRLLPRTHIVVTGIEKVVPDLNDVSVLLRLLTRSATGQPITSYVSVMAGPRGPDESDGPENFHVVLVDNGRSRLIGTEAEETLRCIRCSACLNHCPIYAAVGGHAYGATYPGPIGAALNPNLLGLAQAHHHPNASTFCGRCAEVCPGEDPTAQDYALLARARIRGRARTRCRALWIGLVGLRRETPGALPLRCAPRRAPIESVRRQARRGQGAAADGRLVRGARASRAAGQHLSGHVGGAEMSARDDILAAVRSRRSASRPAAYTVPAIDGDAIQRFSTMAERAASEVRMLGSAAEIPEAVAAILRARNLPASVHLPPGAALGGLEWTRAPGLSVKTAPPGPDDAAIAPAPFAIAETGTLAYPSAAREPASWHFRPGLEIAVLKAGDILPHMEEVLARVKATGWPATLNFVTGPSRTGDIEQTLELGAHGPKALAILIVKA